MKKNNNTLFYMFVFGLLLLLLFNSLKSGSEVLKESELYDLIEKQAINEITLFAPTNSRIYLLEGKIKGENMPYSNDTDKKYEDGEVVSVSVEVLDVDYLLEVLRKNKIEHKTDKKESLFDNFLGFILISVVFIFIIYFLFARQVKSMGKGAMQFGKSKAKMQRPDENKITFDDVAGIEEAKSEVEEIVDYLKDPKKYRDLGGVLPKGCLMVGPPGTGKTLLARAIAGEANVPFFSMSGADFVEMFVGVGASRVRDLFEQAKKYSPCILFIDEIDAVGRSRAGSMNGGGGQDEREQTLNALLVEMDGFDENQGIIVLAATNRADVLDKALLRPGRFDRRVHVDLPDIEGRKKILEVHAKKIKLSNKVDLMKVARACSGFSGADLANLVNEAALMAASLKKKFVSIDDLEEARDKIFWGKQKRSKKMTEKTQTLTAYHEAGHTLVNIFCENSTPLHKVTIIPRGQALGATMMLPERDRYDYSKSELLDEICVTMGGRIAEDITFGEVTSGASSDIKQASSIARRMVFELGMSEDMGFIHYDDGKDNGWPQREYSEEVFKKLDDEVRKIIDKCYAKATKILNDHKEDLKKLSEALLEKETMSAHEIYLLLDIKHKKSPEMLVEDQQRKEEEIKEDDDSDNSSIMPTQPSLEV